MPKTLDKVCDTCGKLWNSVAPTRQVCKATIRNLKRKPVGLCPGKLVNQRIPTKRKLRAKRAGA